MQEYKPIKPLAAAPYILEFEQTGNALDGYLTTTQFAERLPFAIKRVFWIQGAADTALRGRHANKETEEVLVAISGSIKVKTEAASGIAQFELTKANQGLYIPAMCWTELRFNQNTMALCLASTDFDAADYIRDYAAFKELLNHV